MRERERREREREKRERERERERRERERDRERQRETERESQRERERERERERDENSKRSLVTKVEKNFNIRSSALIFTSLLSPNINFLLAFIPFSLFCSLLSLFSPH